MDCSQSKVQNRNPLNEPKSSEQVAKAEKLDENKIKDAETPIKEIKIISLNQKTILCL